MIIVAVGYGIVTPDSFSRSYVLCAIPAVVVWSFNASGVLDGLKLSGMTGCTSALAFFASAAALVFAVGKSDAEAGALLGAALSLGYLLTVAAQILTLQVVGRPLHWARLHRAGVIAAAHDGAAMLAGMLPGQLFFRAQIVLCSMVLGAPATALFLYARQITAALSQLIGMIRRIEFPALVTNLRHDPQRLRSIFLTQRLGTWASGIAATALLLGGIIGSALLPPDFAGAASVVACFAAGVFSGSLYLTLAQGAHALGRHGLVAIATNIGMIVGLAASMGLPPPFGVAGFALAELLMHLVGGCVLIRGLVDRTPHAIHLRPTFGADNA